MPRLQYSRSERTRRKKATTLLDNPDANPSAQAEALKTLRQTEDNARRRLTSSRLAEKDSTDPEAQPDPDGWKPRPAEQTHLDKLVEDGETDQAEVWRLVYKAEALRLDPEEIVRREAANV